MANTVLYQPASADHAVLAVFRRGAAVGVFPLGMLTSIGRAVAGSRCDICLDSGIVSRNHGEIAYVNGQYYYRDTDSTNGTWLNDRLLGKKSPDGQQAAQLQDGDILSIDLPSDGVSHPDCIRAVFSTELDVTAQWKRTLLDERINEIFIGRATHTDVRLASAMVSEKHASFFHAKKGWAILDHNSTNGVYLNGKRLAAPMYLKDFDVVRIVNGYFLYFTDCLLTPEYEQEEAPAAPASPTPPVAVPTPPVAVPTPPAVPKSAKNPWTAAGNLNTPPAQSKPTPSGTGGFTPPPAPPRPTPSGTGGFTPPPAQSKPTPSGTGGFTPPPAPPRPTPSGTGGFTPPPAPPKPTPSGTGGFTPPPAPPKPMPSGTGGFAPPPAPPKPTPTGTGGFTPPPAPVGSGGFAPPPAFPGFVVQYGGTRRTNASDLSIHIAERSVTKGAKKITLLKDIHLTVSNGEMVMILGGSGAGKTTFMNAVMGYEKALGKIEYANSDIYAEYEQMKYKIGYVPQEVLLRPSDTVYYTLLDAAKIKLPKSCGAAERKQRVQQVLEKFSLSKVQDSQVSKISGGQKKHLSAAVEYIADPSLFFLDEPDSGLDGPATKELMATLRSVAQDGKIVMLITHSPERAVDQVDKLIVLAKGERDNCGHLAFYGTVPDAFRFFEAEAFEDILRKIKRKDEHGEGKSDYYIEKYKKMGG